MVQRLATFFGTNRQAYSKLQFILFVGLKTLGTLMNFSTKNLQKRWICLSSLRLFNNLFLCIYHLIIRIFSGFVCASMLIPCLKIWQHLIRKETPSLFSMFFFGAKLLNNLNCSFVRTAIEKWYFLRRERRDIVCLLY